MTAERPKKVAFPMRKGTPAERAAARRVSLAELETAGAALEDVFLHSIRSYRLILSVHFSGSL